MVTSRSQQAACASRRLLHPGGRHSAAGRSGILLFAVIFAVSFRAWSARFVKVMIVRLGVLGSVTFSVVESRSSQRCKKNCTTCTCMYMVYMYMLLSCDVPYRIRRTRRPLSAPHATGFAGESNVQKWPDANRVRDVCPRADRRARGGLSVPCPARGRASAACGAVGWYLCTLLRGGARGRGGCYYGFYMSSSENIYHLDLITDSVSYVSARDAVKTASSDSFSWPVPLWIAPPCAGEPSKSSALHAATMQPLSTHTHTRTHATRAHSQAGSIRAPLTQLVQDAEPPSY